MNARLEALNDNTLYERLGIRLTALAPDLARARMRPPPEVCWPFQGQPHGGIVFTLLDTTMATATLGGPAGPTDCATVGLAIEFVRPARGPSFTCEARVERRGKRTCFVRGEVRDEEGEVVALGQGSFALFGAPPPAANRPDA